MAAFKKNLRLADICIVNRLNIQQSLDKDHSLFPQTRKARGAEVALHWKMMLAWQRKEKANVSPDPGERTKSLLCQEVEPHELSLRADRKMTGNFLNM